MLAKGLVETRIAEHRRHVDGEIEQQLLHHLGSCSTRSCRALTLERPSSSIRFHSRRRIDAYA